jgi:hypothetical protein
MTARKRIYGRRLPVREKPHIVMRKTTYCRFIADVYCTGPRGKAHVYAWTEPMGRVERWKILQDACRAALEEAKNNPYRYERGHGL